MASIEQRSTFRLSTYWNSIRESDKLPDIRAISLSAMGDLWDFCFVLDVNDRHRPEFQHFGAALVEKFGQDYNGQVLDAVAHPVLADIANLLEEVWLMETPVSHCGEVTHGGQALLYRGLIAPLTGGNGVIRYLIGTTNFRLK